MIDKTMNEKEPLRVLMLFTILNRGGAESLAMNYFRNIDRSKVMFDFVVHREEKGDFEDEITALGGRIFRMMPLRPPFGKYEQQIATFFDEHPEYKIIHGHCSESGYFFYKEASKRGIPVIIAHAHNSHVKIDLKWIVRTWMKHQMRPYITHYFTCGEEAAEWLFGKNLAQKAILQKNAIDTNYFQFNPIIRKSKRKELDIPENTLTFCHVGRFDKVKNHNFVIDIFSKILKKKPDARLLLIGEGVLKKQIEQKVEEMGIALHVMFLGTRKDVAELMQASDAMIFPSFFEGFSFAIVEAQCTGLPCVISDIIPNEVMLTDAVTNLSLKESALIWAEKLIATAQRQEDRREYAKKVEQAGFDIKDNAKWLEHFYLTAVRQ